MTELAPGMEFADWRIDGVAGRGGMGVVYCATERRLDRPVALKLIAGSHATDAEFRERFEREARLTASLDHPNVIPVYAAGEQDGRPYLVMRLVRGTDLHALLRREGRLAPSRAAAIVVQVAAALDAAHAAGLVHRDVKPANVLLDADDHVYLTDFGLTRLTSSDTRITETGRWLGTVEFASPEQLRGERCDARSDVYALACVLFAALTGGPPFQRGTVPATMHAVLHERPPAPSALGAPAAFDRVLGRALAKDPADRYPSAGDLGRAASAAARGERVTEQERTVAIGPAAPSEAATAVIPALARNGETAATRVAPNGDGDGDVPGATAATRVVRFDDDHHDGDGRLWSGPPDGGRDASSPPGEDDAGHPPPARGEPAGLAHERKTVRPRRWRGRVLLAVAALGGLAVVGGLAFAGAGGGRPAPRVEPVTDVEVRDAAQEFAADYGTEDSAALGRLLTSDVVRVLPGGTQRGRKAVVAQYASQFASMAITAYELEDLDVRSGDAGRASGRYTVRRRGGASFGGRIVLGVVKERGKVRIRLIAAVPD